MYPRFIIWRGPIIVVWSIIVTMRPRFVIARWGRPIIVARLSGPIIVRTYSRSIIAWGSVVIDGAIPIIAWGVSRMIDACIVIARLDARFLRIHHGISTHRHSCVHNYQKIHHGRRNLTCYLCQISCWKTHHRMSTTFHCCVHLQLTMTPAAHCQTNCFSNL